jgi:hypothetical protein
MRRSLIGVLSFLALALVAPAGASAAVSSTFDVPTDTLIVSSDESGDTIVITCPAANLLVNGAPPSSGALPCSGAPAAGALVLNGNGGGDTSTSARSALCRSAR